MSYPITQPVPSGGALPPLHHATPANAQVSTLTEDNGAAGLYAGSKDPTATLAKPV